MKSGGDSLFGKELVRAVAGGHFLGVAADAVVDAFASEDAGRAGFDAGGAGGGLLGGVEVEEVGALAAGGEGGEGFVERGVFVEFGLQLFGDGLGGGFVLRLHSCLFVFDGGEEEGFEVGLQGFDFLHAGEGDVAPGLGVFAGFLEECAGIVKEGAVAEHEAAVVFEAADEDEIFCHLGRSAAGKVMTPERVSFEGPGTRPPLMTSWAMWASRSGPGSLPYLERMAVARVTRSDCVPVISSRVWFGPQALRVQARRRTKRAFMIESWGIHS